MTGPLPPDPFRSDTEPLWGVIQEGAAVRDGLASLLAEDGGRGLLDAVSLLDIEDVRAALLVSLLEEHLASRQRGRRWRRLTRWLRSLASRRRSSGGNHG